MAYRVTILDTVTDERRTFTMEGEWSGDYIWSDGNFACDCNRGDFFAEAAGEKSDCACGDDRYLVHIEGMDGDLLYEDDSWPPH